MIRAAILKSLDEVTPLPLDLQNIVADYADSHRFHPEPHDEHKNRIFWHSIRDKAGIYYPICERGSCCKHCWLPPPEWTAVSVECSGCQALLQWTREDAGVEVCWCSRLLMYTFTGGMEWTWAPSAEFPIPTAKVRPLVGAARWQEYFGKKRKRDVS